ncbi:YhcN/YlaJ family sporulation lipoprotein [Niallia sp. NCCP-28]|uniref:YhcN/YlaJ family sporulation lipoprotein n=1 Tax=Niallia sp. NCCP-28 TaxID=2934712 RepID=UPI00208B973F|nr:YhcN/YlaJ family sporulation lipoprotein [Niallia sp. NCCP-28]GKU83116.1 lipoprotein YhcN [Niallia sp. NCCP-28]
MKITKGLFVLFGALTILTGCNANDDKENAMNENVNNRNNDVNVQNVGYRTNNHNNKATADLDLADEVADKVTDIKGIKRAVVFKTDRNAFVAVELTGNKSGEVTKKLEDKIANKVRKIDGDIKNVYVSSNPDFYNRMTNYGRDIENGKPISGLFNEFSQMVRRVFPNYR